MESLLIKAELGSPRLVDVDMIHKQIFWEPSLSTQEAINVLTYLVSSVPDHLKQGTRFTYVPETWSALIRAEQSNNYRFRYSASP